MAVVVAAAVVVVVVSLQTDWSSKFVLKSSSAKIPDT